MPVLESADHITPRSALPHRPIADDSKKSGKKKNTTSAIIPVAQRASRQQPKQTEEKEPEKQEDTDTEHEEVEEWKQDTSDRSETRRTRASAAQPSTATGPKKLPKTPLPASLGNKTGSLGRRLVLRAHPLLLLGLGMIAMLILWTLLTLAVSWWNTTWDDIHYGHPRTYQTDIVVGHNDSVSNPSHFIALNLNGRIEVIEFPGGDASKARIYIGPQLYGAGQELIPVTLSFADVNGNQHPDMIIRFHYKGWLGFSDSEQDLVYINDQGTFRPATPDELPVVQRYLQQHG